MKKPPSRAAERERSARFLNSLSREELWQKFGVSRVYEISGFDILGMPVWASTRPLSASVSINSGKGSTTMLARAGAVAEAIEFYFAERPVPFQKERSLAQVQRWNQVQVVPPDRWHLAKGAVLTERSVFDWDLVAPIQHLDEPTCLLPSELIYITECNVTQLRRFQSSTNGWATGASREDAVLQGLYEVVERDGWTLCHYSAEHRGTWPNRIDLDGAQEWPWFYDLLNRLDEVSLRLVLFDVTTDAGLPVVWALLYDLSDKPAGLFGGFGCAGTQTGAIARATMEAVQSRSCYIAGARDDLLRRSFLLMKHLDQSMCYAGVMSCPATVPFNYQEPETLTAEAELGRALGVLAERGFTEFYVRDAGLPYRNLSVTKVYAPCLEQYKCSYWTASPRIHERHLAK